MVLTRSQANQLREVGGASREGDVLLPTAAPTPPPSRSSPDVNFWTPRYDVSHDSEVHSSPDPTCTGTAKPASAQAKHPTTTALLLDDSDSVSIGDPFLIAAAATVAGEEEQPQSSERLGRGCRVPRLVRTLDEEYLHQSLLMVSTNSSVHHKDNNDNNNTSSSGAGSTSAGRRGHAGGACVESEFTIRPRYPIRDPATRSTATAKRGASTPRTRSPATHASHNKSSSNHTSNTAKGRSGMGEFHFRHHPEISDYLATRQARSRDRRHSRSRSSLSYSSSSCSSSSSEDRDSASGGESRASSPAAGAGAVRSSGRQGRSASPRATNPISSRRPHSHRSARDAAPMSSSHTNHAHTAAGAARKRGRASSMSSLNSSITDASMRDESYERQARRDSLARSHSSSDGEDDAMTNKEAVRAVRNARESVEKNICINHYLREVMGTADPRRARRRAIDRRYRHLFVAEELRKLNDDAGGGGNGMGGGGGGTYPEATTASHPMLSSAGHSPPTVGHAGGSYTAAGSAAGALADTSPLHIDPTITFASVGGLPEHIVTLREMVLLPLLYPDVLRRLRVTPPRGVLFVGPPGTGKTLMARALANEGSRCGGRQITFFMRKGADILSKWVGESERQLHLLFDEARRQQPSIIFFDEIDGLAPTRHAKTEQTHAALVATLLALLDGLDDRGQVVVIGATNRPDTIDPALRRPGRFDQELLFPTPDAAGRRHILRILTQSMHIQPNAAAPLAPTAAPRALTGGSPSTRGAADDVGGASEAILSELVRHTEGYTGADLRALCTEAGLNRLRTTLPQIYTSNTRLTLPASAIAELTIRPEDFFAAAQRLRPSLRRGSAAALGTAATLSAVEEHMDALLHGLREAVLRRVGQAWPAVGRARRRGRRDCDDVAHAVRALASFPIPHPRQPLVLLMQVQPVGPAASDVHATHLPIHRTSNHRSHDTPPDDYTIHTNGRHHLDNKTNRTRSRNACKGNPCDRGDPRNTERGWESRSCRSVKSDEASSDDGAVDTTAAVVVASHAGRGPRHGAPGASASASVSFRPTPSRPLLRCRSTLTAAAQSLVLMNSCLCVLQGLPSFRTMTVHLPHLRVDYLDAASLSSGGGGGGGTADEGMVAAESYLGGPQGSGELGFTHVAQLIQAIQRSAPCAVLLCGAEEWLHDQGLEEVEDVEVVEKEGRRRGGRGEATAAARGGVSSESDGEADGEEGSATGARRDGGRFYSAHDRAQRARHMRALRYYFGLLAETEVMLILPCARPSTWQQLFHCRLDHDETGGAMDTADDETDEEAAEEGGRGRARSPTPERQHPGRRNSVASSSSSAPRGGGSRERSRLPLRTGRATSGSHSGSPKSSRRSGDGANKEDSSSSSSRARQERPDTPSPLCRATHRRVEAPEMNAAAGVVRRGVRVRNVTTHVLRDADAPFFSSAATGGGCLLHPSYTVVLAEVGLWPHRSDVQRFVEHLYRTVTLALTVRMVCTAVAQSATGGGAPSTAHMVASRPTQDPHMGASALLSSAGGNNAEATMWAAIDARRRRAAAAEQHAAALTLWRRVEYRRLQLRYVLLKWVMQYISSGRYKILLSADLDLFPGHPLYANWQRHTRGCRIGLQDILEKLEAEVYVCLSQYHEDVDAIVHNVRSFFRAARSPVDQRYRLKALELKQTVVLSLYKINRNVIRFCEEHQSVTEPVCSDEQAHRPEHTNTGRNGCGEDEGRRKTTPHQPRRQRKRYYGEHRRKPRRRAAAPPPPASKRHRSDESARARREGSDGGGAKGVGSRARCRSSGGSTSRNSRRNSVGGGGGSRSRSSSRSDRGRSRSGCRETGREGGAAAAGSTASMAAAGYVAWAVQLLQDLSFYSLHRIFQTVMTELEHELACEEEADAPTTTGGGVGRRSTTWPPTTAATAASAVAALLRRGPCRSARAERVRTRQNDFFAQVLTYAVSVVGNEM